MSEDRVIFIHRTL